MPKIVVIDRLGELKTVNVKDITADNLYKKAGLKSGEGFVLQHTWGQEDGIDQSVELYAKTKGKAGQENKYDFPPPVDSALFFGPCVLIGKDASTGFVVDLDEHEWEEIYEFLFGGFEDVDSEDSDDDDEDVDTDDEVAALAKSTGTVVAQTKNGYVKDGFIVSDEEDEDYEDSEEEESEEERPKKRSAKTTKTSLTKSIAAIFKPKPVKDKKEKERATKEKERATKEKERATKEKEPANQEVTQQLIDLEDCESELSEESYV